MERKKVYSAILAALSSLALASCKKEKQEIRQENLIGYMDVENPKDYPETDFICYNVGNYQKIGVKKQDEKLEECLNNNISTAIIIDCEAKTLIEIYEDIEFTKGILEKHIIDLPVYLNIKNILENDNLSMIEKTNLIKEYIRITEANNIYVGLYGTSTNLSTLNQYGFKITETDCFVVEDGITKYNGKSNIRQDINGNIKSTYQSIEHNNDLASYIKGNYNTSEKFKQNGFAIIDDQITIDEIAIDHNISVNDLLSFNNKTKESLKNGDIIRIPNEIQNKTEFVFPELKRQETAVARGIDISRYQGPAENTDFKALSQKIDFAILKICEQFNFDELNEDKYFNDYYYECIENNIPIGGYYVTHATTVNEAIKEAKLVANRIKDLNITYPIYIDYENIPNTAYEEEFNEVTQNGGFGKILEEVNKIFKETGVRFGIYSNLSTYDEMKKMVGLQTLNKYEIWLARNNYYTKTYEVKDNGPICKTENGKYEDECDMNQVSDRIDDLKIGERVDYNLCYKDYTKPKYLVELPPEKEFETKKYDRKESTNIPKVLIPIGGSVGLLCVGYGIMDYTVTKRKKQKRKIR